MYLSRGVLQFVNSVSRCCSERARLGAGHELPHLRRGGREHRADYMRSGGRPSRLHLSA
jgi:hypothetical protein